MENGLSFVRRVAVSLPVQGSFFYAVPEGLLDRAEVGCRVRVPFKNRSVTGYIVGIGSERADLNLKTILEILDPEPLFPISLVPFFEWMSEYYLCPLGHVIHSALPGGLTMRSGKTAFLTERGKRALASLPRDSDEAGVLLWVRENPGKRLPPPLQRFQILEKREWLSIRESVVRRQVGPLMRRFVRPRADVVPEALFRDEDRFKAKDERAFLEMAFRREPWLLSELCRRFSNGAYLAKKWIRNGVLEAFEAPVCRDPVGHIMAPSPVPSRMHTQQREALSHIETALGRRGFSACLLYGVTGSGKTEVYYRAVLESLRLGRRAILMVPEIALAVYMEAIFRSRLQEGITVYHSGLSQGERYDQWVKMARGEVNVVIGARSALFSPLPDLGLIIVDEEHDAAYKQEGSLRYQARDAALMRAKMEKAVVILGSGTPSVQSFHNAGTGKYHLLTMPHRVERRPLPDVDTVDMNATQEGDSGTGMISPGLHEALRDNLEEGNQSILFLNRRGFHRLHVCRACGRTIRCPNCDVALTHHLAPNTFVCHYCGFTIQAETNCPSCRTGRLRAYGFGTEKLEKALTDLFPGARIARMDTDSTRKKGSVFKILRAFGEGKIDILVGTQMITKGFDFPSVTLVGIIAADLSLAFPDFRAGERTFQLLSQVAGRAGRGAQRGRVIVQTFNPDHYAVRMAIGHDYPGFFEMEKELRSQLGYPPFSHLACLRLQGNSKDKTAESAEFLCRTAKAVLSRWPKRGREIQVLGPVEAPLSRLKGKYRWQILVKSKHAALMRHFLVHVEGLTGRVLQAKGVHLIVDVDPYQMI